MYLLVLPPHTAAFIHASFGSRMLALGLAKGDGRVHVLVHVQCLCRFMVKEQGRKQH
jgi:hypothetical protein